MIGIIGALQVEVDAIRHYMKNEQQKTLHTIQVYEGIIHDQQVVLCLSKVGKVNAAMAATILLSNYPITELINIGTAGGLRSTQKTLDVVISNEVIQHDFDTSLVDGKEGIGLTFKSEHQKCEKIKNIFEKINHAYRYEIGVIASGDQFIADEKQLEKIMQQFPNAIACEMEAGAIGQVASQFNVDFIIIRALSDIVYQDNSHIDFIKNVEITSARSAKAVAEYLHG